MYLFAEGFVCLRGRGSWQTNMIYRPSDGTRSEMSVYLGYEDL